MTYPKARGDLPLYIVVYQLLKLLYMVDDKMDTIEMTKWIQNKEIYKEIYKEIFSRQSLKKLLG